MSLTYKLVNKILHKNSGLCCLCLSTIDADPIGMEDEVSITMLERNVQVSDIMSFIFGDEILNDISALNEFCIDCVTTASNSYQFIVKSKDNIQLLENAVNQLNSCFETVPDDLTDCKTLFVTLNSNLGITHQYYDNVVIAQNVPSALQRFKSIVDFHSPKIKQNTNKEGKIPRENTKLDIKKIMTDKRPLGQLQCRLCLKLYNNVATLKEHFLRFHSPKQYKCESCPKLFAFKKHVVQHKENCHANLVCRDCGKSFRNKYTLRAHEETHAVRLVCPDCGRVYKNRNTLKKHKENDICQLPYRHSPADAKFTCDYCQKRYTQKISLRVHIQYEHLGYKYLECQWCDKKFNCQSRLNAHAVKHTKERNFQCTYCGRKFVSKESLLYHTRIHTGEKPYQCPHCDSRFLSASRRQAHVKSYHMDPTVECDICHNKFRSVQYLQKHKKIHFPENPDSISSSGHHEEIVVEKEENVNTKNLNQPPEDFTIPSLNKNNERKTYSNNSSRKVKMEIVTPKIEIIEECKINNQELERIKPEYSNSNSAPQKVTCLFQTETPINIKVTENYSTKTQALESVITKYNNSPVKNYSENSKMEALMCYVENSIGSEVQENVIFY